MADDFGIDLNLRFTRDPSTVGRPSVPSAVPEGQDKPLKQLGDPPPPRADIREYPERLQQAFTYAGLLEVLRRKLNALTGERYTIVPSQGHQVCISETGAVHVGMDFLAENLSTPAIVAGVLAHEWGHFPNRRKGPKNLDALSWDEVYRLRREEETKADMFCGRALFMLRYPCEPLIDYLTRHEDKREKSPKYHTVESRAKVIRESYDSQGKRHALYGNIRLTDAVYGDPIHGSRLIGS